MDPDTPVETPSVTYRLVMSRGMCEDTRKLELAVTDNVRTAIAHFDVYVMAALRHPGGFGELGAVELQAKRLGEGERWVTIARAVSHIDV